MTKKALIYGGKGALGSAIVDAFKAGGWWTLCVDLAPSDTADVSVVVPPGADSLVAQTDSVTDLVAKVSDGAKFQSIVCVAGGWAGGNAAAAELATSADAMWKQSVWSSLVATSIAAKQLDEGGLLVLTGAVPSLGGTSGMIGYGMAKAAVHQLVASLAQDNSGLPSGASVMGILPVTLDTPMNRKWMAKADQTTWTPLDTVAQQLLNWSGSGEARPASGSLVQLLTRDGKTDFLAKPFA